MSDWNDCECNPIAPPLTEAGPPGPAGLPGEDGADGTNGKNSFTVTTENFTVLLPGENVTIAVLDASWMVPTQFIHILGAGNYKVAFVGDLTHATVFSTGATGNALSGTVVVAGAKVGPAGEIGPAGSAVSFPITIAQGGTGQTTALGSFNALSPLTAKGDLLGHDGLSNIKVAVGTDAYALIADPTQPSGWKWGQLDLTKGVTGILPMANGGTGTGTLPDGAILVGNGVAPVTGLKCNFSATTDPTTADDSPHQGYSVGSRWFNTETEQEWVCTDSTDSNAVWRCTTSSTGSAIVRKEVVGSYTVEDGVNLVAVKATGPVTIALLDGPQYSANIITIKDEGTSATPTITIDPNGSQTIEGVINYTILVKGGSLSIYWDTTSLMWRVIGIQGRPLRVAEGGLGEDNFTAKLLLRMNNAGTNMESNPLNAAIPNVTPVSPANGSIAALPFTTPTAAECIALRNATEGLRDTVESLETRVNTILTTLRNISVIAP